MYRIIKQNPPDAQYGAPESLSKFLRELDTNHRGDFYLLDKKRKHLAYLYQLRRKQFPNMEIVTRKNKDGTFGVWVKFHDDPVELRIRRKVNPES